MLLLTLGWVVDKGTDANLVRIDTHDLKVGMYVAKLDRDWLDSPFLFQGFPLERRDLIEEVQAVCSYVFVDADRSANPADVYARRSKERVADLKLEDIEKPRRKRKNWKAGERERVYTEDVATEKELASARRALASCLVAIHDLFSAVKRGLPLELTQLRESVESLTSSMVRNPDAVIWLSRLGRRDGYTFRHCINTGIWSVALGRQLGLPEDDLQMLGLGAICCDIGKALLPPKLLRYPGRLTDKYVSVAREHVSHSLKILESAKTPVDAAVVTMVEQHHERFDGSGYPRGIQGDEIDLFARIAAIADSFDAIINERPFQSARCVSAAIREMYEGRGQAFQPELLEEFIQAIGLYPAGTLIELSTGAVGAVVGQSRVRRLQPRIILILDDSKEPLGHYPIVDLLHDQTDSKGRFLSIVRDLKPGAYGIDPISHI